MVTIQQPQTTEICPIKVDGHTQRSFDLWVKELYAQLSKRTYIDCRFEDFSNLFVLNKLKRKQGKKVDWLEDSGLLSVLMKRLNEEKFIAEPFWRECASCFTVNGEEIQASNMRTYYSRVNAERRDIINKIIHTLK